MTAIRTDDRKGIPPSESLHLKCVSQVGGAWVNQRIEDGSSQKAQVAGLGRMHGLLRSETPEIIFLG